MTGKIGAKNHTTKRSPNRPSFHNHQKTPNIYINIPKKTQHLYIPSNKTTNTQQKSCGMPKTKH